MGLSRPLGVELPSQVSRHSSGIVICLRDLSLLGAASLLMFLASHFCIWQIYLTNTKLDRLPGAFLGLVLCLETCGHLLVLMVECRSPQPDSAAPTELLVHSVSFFRFSKHLFSLFLQSTLPFPSSLTLLVPVLVHLNSLSIVYCHVFCCHLIVPTPEISLFFLLNSSSLWIATNSFSLLKCHVAIWISASEPDSCLCREECRCWSGVLQGGVGVSQVEGREGVWPRRCECGMKRFRRGWAVHGSARPALSRKVTR